MEAIQEMCQKMTAGSGEGLHHRRPHALADNGDGRPPVTNGASHADFAADAPPPPPPSRAKTPAHFSAAPAEQIQGIWYGWA